MLYACPWFSLLKAEEKANSNGKTTTSKIMHKLGERSLHSILVVQLCLVISISAYHLPSLTCKPIIK